MEKSSPGPRFFLKVGSWITGEPCGNSGTFQCSIYLPLLPSPASQTAQPCPTLPGLATFKDCDPSSPSLPALHWATHHCVPCRRNVAGMLQACSGMFQHGHFHLAACATQVRWQVARATPALCLAVELRGGGAWFPSHSLSLERN